jgi:hypothetical protein
MKSYSPKLAQAATVPHLVKGMKATPSIAEWAARRAAAGKPVTVGYMDKKRRIH